ncbi:MAG TPA: FliM/FliN family flagellar motor switch protein [Paracoccaceae bacterium]
MARDEQEARAMSPARALRLATEKTANDVFSLVLSVQAVARSRVDHPGLLALIPDGLLLLLLDGPDGAVGVMTLDSATLSALIEMQTVGQVLPRPPRDRPLTRTDAALAAPLVDGILQRMTQDLSDHADRYWACGFRFGAMIDDRRSLGLTLDAPDYHVFRVDLDIAGGARQGEVILVLPWREDPEQHCRAAGREVSGRQLQTRVMDAPVRLDAVLCRVSLPLSEIGKLVVGDVLPLPAEALREIALEGVGRRRVATGRLGKIDGLRAICLNMPGGMQAPQSTETQSAADSAPADGRAGGAAIMPERLRPKVQPATQDDPLTVFGHGTDDPAPDEVSTGSFAALGEMRITDDLDDLSRFGLDIGPDAA